MAHPFGIGHFPIDPAPIPPVEAPIKTKQGGNLGDLALSSTYFTMIALAMLGWLYVLFLLLRATALWAWPMA